MKRLIVLASLFMVGCVSVPRDSGYSDVQRLVRERAGHRVSWEPDRRIDAPSVTATLPDGELTVEQAVNLALTSNRDLQATLENLGIARAELIEASTIRNPILHAEVRFPGEPRKPVELELTQALLDLFQLPTRRALARANFAAEQNRVAAAVIRFAAQVRTHYYDLQAAQQLLGRQRVITDAARIAAELALRQHDAGNISDLDLEHEQARYEEAKLDLAATELTELQARERLVADLGLSDPPSTLMLPPQFPTLPESETDLASVESTALAERLDIRLARQELEIAQRGMPIARAAVFSDVELDLHYETEPDGASTTGPGVTVPIPIFNRGTGPRQRAIGQVRRAEQRLHALTLVARSEARTAREQLVEARSRAQYLRDVVVPRRQRILQLTLLEYNAMLLGVFELIEARQNLSHAEREHVLAMRDYWVARTELETALNGVARFSVREEFELDSRKELR